MIEKLSKLITKCIKGMFKKEEVNDNAMENISLNMTNDDYTQILKKLAKKDVEGNTYLNKTLKPVLNTKAFKKSL